MICGMKAVVRSDWAGQVVDGLFPLRDWLGGSAHSGVYLTVLPEDPARKVVIKLIPAGSIDLEASILGKPQDREIVHPHLMPMLYVGACMLNGIDIFYVVMDYADEVLASLLPQRALTARETREMLDPVLDALSYLHENGLVHAHLKPSNLLVSKDRLQIAMDGICFAGSLGRSGSAHSIYDAPEIGSLPFSAATDMWSLGMTIVETLTQHPLDWNRAIEAVPKVPPEVPEPFASIARACLQPQPSLRCSISDVRSMLAGQSLSASGTADGGSQRHSRSLSTDGWGSTEGAARPRRRLRAAILSAATAVAVFFAVWELRSSRQATPPDASAAVPQASSVVPRSHRATATPKAKPRPEHRASADSPSVEASPNVVVPEASVGNGVVKQVMPKVLPSAQASIQGKVNVIVRVTAGSSGDVTSTELESPGPSRYFARISQEAAQQWRFDPAANGSARTWLLHFAYRQSSVSVTPSLTSR